MSKQQDASNPRVLKEVATVRYAVELKVTPLATVNFAFDAQGLYATLQSLFHDAQEENFEDGMASAFSRRLLVLLESEGEALIQQLSLLIDQEQLAPEVLSEALRWFGQVQDEATFTSRCGLLERALGSPSVLVRDGAILGLSFLADARVLPILEKAYINEPQAVLRVDIAQAIGDLRDMMA